jgi:hypothetical protein
LEDQVLPRAVALVLEAVSEQDFLPCSYGFRPGRSAPQALDALWRQTMGTGGGWVVEGDLRKFCATLGHARLRELLRQRLRDGVLVRLIGTGLKAGVLEGGSVPFPSTGTPQGGVLTPPTLLQKSPSCSLEPCREPVGAPGTARAACRAEGSPRAGGASRREGFGMAARPSPVRPLPAVRRGYEFSRLQPQLLALAYEHLQPILRRQQPVTTTAARPPRPQAMATAPA